MKKYLLLAFSLLLIPSFAFAQGRNNAFQQVTKQRDIADYNCRNNLPNPNAARGYCNKRDGLQKRLDGMDRGQQYKNKYNNRNKWRKHNRNHRHNNHNHNHRYNYNYDNY